MSEPSSLSLDAARNHAGKLLAAADAALEAGEIAEEQWYGRVAAVITPAYLRAANPRAQSGHSGDEAHWEAARRLVVDGLAADGTFLDIGCANGYLMECAERWSRSRGCRIEPYGLDISPELAALARARLPHWADRIVAGNAISWVPPRRFACVRTGLEYVPARRQPDLIAHLLAQVVAPGGRLIIGTYNEECDATRPGPSLAEQVESWGFAVRGGSERPHYHDPRLVYRVLWLDAPAGWDDRPPQAA